MSIFIPDGERYYDSKKMIYSLPENVIFVFGSNRRGIHGLGSAKTAVKHFGAVYGNGFGKQGQSYGIATKDNPSESLSLEEIKVYVDKFHIYHDAHPELLFLVTRIGCGYAGHSDKDIAPLFKGGLDRCYFPDIWEPYLKQEGI